jgi:hypothetical protein
MGRQDESFKKGEWPTGRNDDHDQSNRQRIQNEMPVIKIIRLDERYQPKQRRKVQGAVADRFKQGLGSVPGLSRNHKVINLNRNKSGKNEDEK